MSKYGSGGGIGPCATVYLASGLASCGYGASVIQSSLGRGLLALLGGLAVTAAGGVVAPERVREARVLSGLNGRAVGADPAGQVLPTQAEQPVPTGGVQPTAWVPVRGTEGALQML